MKHNNEWWIFCISLLEEVIESLLKVLLAANQANFFKVTQFSFILFDELALSVEFSQFLYYFGMQFFFTLQKCYLIKAVQCQLLLLKVKGYQPNFNYEELTPMAIHCSSTNERKCLVLLQILNKLIVDLKCVKWFSLNSMAEVILQCFFSLIH